MNSNKSTGIRKQNSKVFPYFLLEYFMTTWPMLLHYTHRGSKNAAKAIQDITQLEQSFSSQCFHSMPLTTWQSASDREEHNLAKCSMADLSTFLFLDLIKISNKNKSRRDTYCDITMYCTAVECFLFWRFDLSFNLQAKYAVSHPQHWQWPVLLHIWV